MSRKKFLLFRLTCFIRGPELISLKINLSWETVEIARNSNMKPCSETSCKNLLPPGSKLEENNFLRPTEETQLLPKVVYDVKLSCTSLRLDRVVPFDRKSQMNAGSSFG